MVTRYEYNAVWKQAYDYTRANWEPGVSIDIVSAFPPEHSGAAMEGMRSGINKRLDELYPGAKTLAYNPRTRSYDATY